MAAAGPPRDRPRHADADLCVGARGRQDGRELPPPVGGVRHLRARSQNDGRHDEPDVRPDRGGRDEVGARPMLITWIDVAFALAGAGVVVYALRRRPRPPDPVPAPPATRGELLLTLLAAVPAAVGPNILVVALTPGMPGMPALVRLALLPSIALLVLVWRAARRAGYRRVLNPVETGGWGGFGGPS